jgi:hypothetical protein
LWGLCVLPLIILLYMLRTRRQDVPVSTLILWQRARRDLAAQRPARRLERSLLLLLQLLAAALIVLALAKPQLSLSGGQIPSAVIIDTSASMQATDETPTRFAAAVRRAQQVVASAGGPVMIIEAGPIPRIVIPFSEPGAARAALGRMRPTDGPGRLEQALTLALGQRAGGARPRVEVFTDRAGDAMPGVMYHVVGSSSHNVGVFGVNVERDAGGSVLIIQIQNAGDRSERVPVIVTMGDRRLHERTVDVGAHAIASVSVPLAGSGVARIELAVRDLLPVDNVAHAVVGTPPPRVIIAGSSDRVLTEALASIPVRFAPAQRVTPEALASADVVILNRTPPVELPPGNYLLLGTVAQNLPLTVEGTSSGGTALRWSQRHPVMRYVDLGEVTIGQALRLLPRGGEVLAEGDTPLIWAHEGDGVRAVVMAFALDQSDLPLRVAFPIFLSNALSWLSGADRIYQTGDTVAIPSGSVPEAVVDMPDGARHRLAASSGRVVIPYVERAGIYTVRVGSREQRLAVNPAAEEINIAPVGAPRSPSSAGAAPAGERTGDIWRLILGLALVVLCAEWVLWLRGLPRTPKWGRNAYLLRQRGSHG